MQLGFPGGSDGKESACNAGDLDLICGLGKRNGYPLQISIWEIPWTKGLGGLSPWGQKELDMTEWYHNTVGYLV